MLYRFDDRRPFPDLESDLERLRGLIWDLERIHRGQHPDKATLAEAPRLDDWNIARRPEACLTGIMTGHPKIADDQLGATSGVWVLAPGLGYARTLSRFYALGRASDACSLGRRFS